MVGPPGFEVEPLREPTPPPPIKESLSDDKFEPKKEIPNILEDFTGIVFSQEKLEVKIEENEPEPTNMNNDINASSNLKTETKDWKRNFCYECNKLLKTEHSFIKHMLRHTSNKPYLCQQCTLGFSSIKDLEIHKMRHNSKDDKMPYKCSDCIKSFASKHALKKHIARIHSSTETYNCNVCSHYRPSSYEDLQFHMIGHNTNEERPYKCDKCPKTFKKGFVLKEHNIIVHDKTYSYKCGQCEKSYKSAHGLSAHNMLHTGEKPFACQHCPKTFSQSGSLNYHLRRHSGEKPYLCQVCPKTFIDSSTLTLHTRMHEGTKPFICEQCSKSFYVSNALKTHLLYSHTNEKPHVCEVCSRYFKKEKNLKKHIKSQSHIKSIKNTSIPC